MPRSNVNTFDKNLVQRMLERQNERKKTIKPDGFTLQPFKYFDKFQPSPTEILITTSETFITGKYRWELQRCKKLLAHDFKRGIVILSTKYEVQKKQGVGQPLTIPKIIIFDLDYFLTLFLDQRDELYDSLKKNGETVVEKWNEKNKDKKMYNRLSEESTMESDPHYYKDAQGQEHESRYTFGITAFGFTAKYQAFSQFPEIRLEDLTFTLKLRTTERQSHWVESSANEDHELGFVKNGYTAPLLHFLSMLESPNLSQFMNYTKKTFEQRDGK